MKNELLKVAQEALTEDDINEIIKEKFKKAISDACDEAFNRWGDVNKTITKKITETFIPYLEEYNFDSYLVKLDYVLTEIVNSPSVAENKKLLENFQYLLKVDEQPKEIEITDLFSEWIKHCNEHIDTFGLEVNCDDGPSYEHVEATMETEDISSDWSIYKRIIVRFTNDHDEDLNSEFILSKWEKETSYKIVDLEDSKINSLKSLSKFEILLRKLLQSDTKIILDRTSYTLEIEPEAEPEATFG